MSDPLNELAIDILKKLIVEYAKGHLIIYEKHLDKYEDHQILIEEIEDEDGDFMLLLTAMKKSDILKLSDPESKFKH